MEERLDPHLFFYRDQKGHEVDFIYQTGRDLIPIEAKSAETFHPEFLKGLCAFEKLAEGRSSRGYLVYGGIESQPLGSAQLLPIQEAWRCVGPAPFKEPEGSQGHQLSLSG